MEFPEMPRDVPVDLSPAFGSVPRNPPSQPQRECVIRRLADVSPAHQVGFPASHELGKPLRLDVVPIRSCATVRERQRARPSCLGTLGRGRDVGSLVEGTWESVTWPKAYHKSVGEGNNCQLGQRVPAFLATNTYRQCWLSKVKNWTTWLLLMGCFTPRLSRSLLVEDCKWFTMLLLVCCSWHAKGEENAACLVLYAR